MSNSVGGSAGVGRLAELYRDGGLRELRRGVRDYVLLDTNVPVERFVRTGTLRAGGVEALLKATSSEALWRCGGHGEQAVQADFVEKIVSRDFPVLRLNFFRWSDVVGNYTGSHLLKFLRPTN